ncbi:hypothetical protein BCR33DRAFT_714086 [Rhizoclosmatium globosum]|uniref:SMP-LTD domain-containing protein n=1 Tax=Rhizoclosmatium globosum TaxID=329046 RepID=A0A1Y2CQ07_9FUNG|nr:hypothetical protein BCR33DRAFT_714086 [Rhizoclosmatium globosum]|eukprot:ORY49006.1 hypothetical protein BCR33DRAFT_714086 [Rhizoclosmatium globosum]
MFGLAFASMVLFDPMRATVAPMPASFSAFDEDEHEQKQKSDSATNNEQSTTRTDFEFSAWPRGVASVIEAALSAANSTSTPTSTSTSNASSPSFEWDAQNVDTSPTDTAPWLNIVVARFFLSLRDSSLFKTKICAKLMDRLNAKLRSTQNMFVNHVRLHDLRLGHNFPKVLGVRMLKGLTDDLAVALEVDVSYDGGASVAIEPTLTRGLAVPLRVSINALKGKLRVRVPAIGYSDMFSVSFLEDPGVSFKVEAPTITVADNDMVRGMVSSVLSEIVRRVFLEMWVFPGWRTFFLPLMIPSVEDEMRRMDEVNKNSRDAKSTSSNNGGVKNPRVEEYFAIARAQRNPELYPFPSSTASILSSTSSSFTSSQTVMKPYDLVNTSKFPLSIILESSSAAEKLPLIEETLVSTFMGLVQEVSTRKGPLSNAVVLGSNGATISTSDWKTIKSGNGIVVKKCTKKMDGFANSDVNWANLTINCDAERVFVILSNPEYMRHCEPSYIESSVLKQFDESRSIRQSVFQLAKNSIKTYTVFEIQKRIFAQPAEGENVSALDPSPLDSFLIVTRTVAAFKDDDQNGELLSLDGPRTLETLPRTETQQQSRSASPTRPVVSSRGNSPSRERPATTPDPSNVSTSAPPSPTKIAANLIYETASAPVPLFPPSRSTSLPRSNAPVSSVYFQGFLIEPTPSDPNTCSVTVLSHLSSDLSRLETNFAACKKLKSFVEEYISHVDGVSIIGDETKKSTFGDAFQEYAWKGQELKNMLRTKVKGWTVTRSNTMGSTSTQRVPSPTHDNGLDSSSDYEDTAAEFVSARSRGFDAVSEVGSRATAESTSSSVAQQVKSRVEAVTSIAKTMKRPSMGFLTRTAVVAAGGMMQTQPEGEEADGSGKRSKSGSFVAVEPFSIGKTADPALFVTKRIVGKDVLKEEVVFRREDFQNTVEIAWEFVLKADQSIMFGLSFRPDFSSSATAADASRNIALLFPESVNEYGTRQIIPYGSVTTGLVPTCRGNICLSSFSSGTFIFSWDNINGTKKQEKEFTFRSLFRPFEIPRPPSPALLDQFVIGEFGFDQFGRGQHNTGMVGEVTINRKSLYRACLPFDSSMERYNSARELETVTYLTWDYATNGLEVMFGIYYYPMIGGGETNGDSNVVSAVPAPSHPSEGNLIELDEVSLAVGTVGGNVDATGQAANDDLTESDATSGISDLGIPPRPQGPPPKPVRKNPQSPTLPATSPVPLSGKLSLAARLEAVAAKDHHTPSVSTDQDTSSSASASATHSRQTSMKGYRATAIPVLPMTKVKTNIGSTLSGTLAVPIDRGSGGRKGVYAFVWDNTGSVMLPKVISFRVGLITTAVGVSNEGTELSV